GCAERLDMTGPRAPRQATISPAAITRSPPHSTAQRHGNAAISTWLARVRPPTPEPPVPGVVPLPLVLPPGTELAWAVAPAAALRTCAAVTGRLTDTTMAAPNKASSPPTIRRAS